MPTLLLRLASLVAVVGGALALTAAPGCATSTDEPAFGEHVDGEHAAEDDDTASGAEALTAHDAQSLTVIAPPLARVATQEIPALFGPPIARGVRLLVTRALHVDGAPARVVVDADSLVSSVVRAASLAEGAREAVAGDAVTASPFAKSLAETARLASANHALDRVAPSAKTGPAAEPFALTIDMCQSKKPWDAALFAWAVSLSDRIHAPVPVGIAMTGGWARAHPRELDQLGAWITSGKLAVTWINHSSTHPLNCLDATCRRAEFLTAASVDFDAEVLGLEQALVARGLVPSVLFRVPGLVHDTQRLARLAELSLLPLDANAWIAKGQPIGARTVVLVHGNGNEPPGIRGFLAAVQTESRAEALASGRSALVSPLLVAPIPPSR